MDNLKLYVIVRGDIPKSWYAPQACHAVAEYTKDHPENFKQWNNHNIVILKCKDRYELHGCMEELQDEGVDYSVFRESHLDAGMTATAFTSFIQIEAFQKLKLL